MKLNGLQIEEHGSGFALTLRVHVGREEFRDGMSDDVTDDAVGIFTTVVHSTIAFSKKTTLVRESADEQKLDETGTSENKRPEEPSTPGSRRRQRAKAKGSRETEADPTGAPAAERKGQRRKKGSSSSASTQKEKAGASSTKSELTDEDLSKAASEAAQSIGAPKVMEILGEFKVEKVNQLKSKQRLEFKQRLDQEVATADDGIPF